MKYVPRLPQTNVNVSERSPIREFLVLAGGVLGLVVIFYIILGALVDWVAPYISPRVESGMASLFIDRFTENSIQDERQAALQELTDQLAACYDLPYEVRVHLIEDKMINAMALPGGHILIFTGLLNKMASENELAFVLGHELGHFANKDHLRRMGRSLVFVALSVALFGDNSGMAEMVSGTVQLTELGFSRRQESDADRHGLQILNCRYGHVGGATHFFEKMPSAIKSRLAGHYLSSHPEKERRINQVYKVAAEMGFEAGELESLPAALISQSDSVEVKN